MLSRTKIKSRAKKKTNPELAETIKACLANSAWSEVAKILSGPTRNHASVSLTQIESEAADGDTVIVPGKVLSQGSLNKKVKVCALSFSDKAKEKLDESKIKFSTIKEEVKSNSKFEGAKIIK